MLNTKFGAVKKQTNRGTNCVVNTLHGENVVINMLSSKEVCRLKCKMAEIFKRVSKQV
jgi:hypothetical protein